MRFAVLAALACAASISAAADDPNTVLVPAPPGWTRPQVFAPNKKNENGPTRFCVRRDLETEPAANHYYCYDGVLIEKIMKTQSAAYLRAIADELDPLSLPTPDPAKKRRI